MEKHTWKVGDWCYCNFELSVIEDMSDGRVMGVSTGYVRSGGDHTDALVPLSKRSKVISEEFQARSRSLHGLTANINHPDIRRRLNQMWLEACADGDDNDKCQEHFDKLKNFCDEITATVTDKHVDGVRVFR